MIHNTPAAGHPGEIRLLTTVLRLLAADQLTPSTTTPKRVCYLHTTSPLRLLLCVATTIDAVAGVKGVAAIRVGHLQLACSCETLPQTLGPIATVNIPAIVPVMTKRAWDLTIVAEVLARIGTLVVVAAAVAHGAQAARGLRRDVLVGLQNGRASCLCVLSQACTTQGPKQGAVDCLAA